MNIGKMLTQVGGSLLKNAFPPLSGMAFDAINAALPDGKKLAEDATGLDAEIAMKELPPEQRASLMEKKLEVTITEIKEWSAVMETLNKTDATGKSTRPAIAILFAIVVAYAELVAITAWAVTVYKDPSILSSTWPLVVAIIAPPLALLRGYFGLRTKEKEKRYEMAGAPAQTGWVSSLISAVKGK